MNNEVIRTKLLNTAQYKNKVHQAMSIFGIFKIDHGSQKGAYSLIVDSMCII